MFGIGGKKSSKNMSGAEKLGAKIGDAIGDALFKPAKPMKRGYKHDYSRGLLANHIFPDIFCLRND